MILIARLNVQETGLPKSYSKRKFVASFKADPELWSRFKTETKERGVSECYVLEALMEAWIEGQKATSTVLKPVTVNLTMQHVVDRPRRKLLEQGPAFGVGCFRLQHNDIFPGRLGWCPRFRKWVRLEDCQPCSHNGEFSLLEQRP